MADVNSVDEEAMEFPEKRKLDLPKSIIKATEEDNDQADSNKKLKIENNGSDEHLPQPEDILTVNTAAEDEDDDDDEEDYNGEQEDEEAEVVDRKGKGIMKDEKGKGKMIDESEDDDDSDGDDDSSDDDSDSDDLADGLDDSDVEDDPLAEVDLDNILPSRTRQRRALPGLRISDDPAKGNDA